MNPGFSVIFSKLKNPCSYSLCIGHLKVKNLSNSMLLSNSKKIAVLFCFNLISNSLLGQTSTSCTLKYEEVTTTQTCRYCAASTFSTTIENVRFEENDCQNKYYPYLTKLKGAAIMKAVYMKGKDLPDVCDISRTGRHGIEESYSRNTVSEDIERSVCDENLAIIELREKEAKQAEDERQRVLNLKKEEEQRVLDLNKRMFETYDYFYSEFRNCALNQDTTSLKEMMNSWVLLADLYESREGAEAGFLLDQTIQMEIPSDNNGFGGKYKEFTFGNLTGSIFWAQIYTGKYESLLEWSSEWNNDYKSHYYPQLIFASLCLKDFGKAVDYILEAKANDPANVRRIDYLLQKLLFMDDEYIHQLNVNKVILKRDVDRFLKKCKSNGIIMDPYYGNI